MGDAPSATDTDRAPQPSTTRHLAGFAAGSRRGGEIAAEGYTNRSRRAPRHESFTAARLLPPSTTRHHTGKVTMPAEEMRPRRDFRLIYICEIAAIHNLFSASRDGQAGLIQATSAVYRLRAAATFRRLSITIYYARDLMPTSGILLRRRPFSGAIRRKYWSPAKHFDVAMAELRATGPSGGGAGSMRATPASRSEAIQHLPRPITGVRPSTFTSTHLRPIDVSRLADFIAAKRGLRPHCKQSARRAAVGAA